MLWTNLLEYLPNFYPLSSFGLVVWHCRHPPTQTLVGVRDASCRPVSKFWAWKPPNPNADPVGGRYGVP